MIAAGSRAGVGQGGAGHLRVYARFFLFVVNVLETMPDDQHRLSSRQRLEIDQIGQKFHFNLAPPPSSLDEITTGPKFVSLTDFIEQFDWEYADLDIIDRREIKDLAAEDFWRLYR
jgi:hypothetical protein